MTASKSNTDRLVEQLAAIGGVMRDDIHVHEEKVTTYVPIDRLDEAEGLDGVAVEILEEHEHEYLISVTPRKSGT
jgi:hypothetical protein